MGWEGAAGAQFGVSLATQLLGAHKTAQSSRVQMAGNRAAMSRLKESEMLLPEMATARQEVAESEFSMAYGQTADKTSTMYDDLFMKQEQTEGIQGFSYSGGAQKEFDLLSDRLNKDFETKRGNLLSQLDKQSAGIEAWKTSESQRLRSEQEKLKWENKRLKGSSTFLGALGLKF